MPSDRSFVELLRVLNAFEQAFRRSLLASRYGPNGPFYVPQPRLVRH